MYDFMDVVVLLWRNGRQDYVVVSIIAILICFAFMFIIVGDGLSCYYEKRRRTRYYKPDAYDRWIISHFSNDELGILRQEFDKMNLPNDMFVCYLSYVGIKCGYIEEGRR